MESYDSLEKLGLSAALAALEIWNIDTAIIMTAIAGAESGWSSESGGGTPRTLFRIGSSYANDALEYNCPLGDMDGAAAWGLWQIFMPLHGQVRLGGLLFPSEDSLLGQLGAPIDDSCQLARWLCIPENNALAADRILKEQGYGAWCVYNSGAYLKYLARAHNIIKEIVDRKNL